MITAWLLSILRCPQCVTSTPTVGHLIVNTNTLVCADCGAQYMMHDGYVDMRPPTGITGKETVYTDPEVALDDPSIRPPLLSAGVRQWVLRLLLKPRTSDALIDLGCGNGKFAVWNRSNVAHLVGLDPAARFAAEARERVDLVQGDARALPFGPETFTGAYSLDVLEHLDLSGVRAHLSEVRRVVTSNGRYFCFSNTRERSWLNRLIDPGRNLAETLHRAGMVDRSRDHIRKGDHVKAVETSDALRDELRRADLSVSRLWYLNPLLATYIETIGFAIAERAIARRGAATAPSTAVPGKREDHSIRTVAAQRPLVRAVLRIATALMTADVTFFRHVRTGPFFLLARPVTRR